MSLNNISGHGSNLCMPNIVLKSALNVLVKLACSIYPKIDEIRNIFSEVEIDVICVSETWPKAYSVCSSH